MATLNPYLTFNGNCEEAFKFYKSVFGGAFLRVERFKNMPPMEGKELPESAQEKIMHISLPISKETVLMGCDANPMMGEVSIGQNISLSVNAKSKDEADKIFRKLSEGGKITLPIAEQFWNSYFGMITDKYNNIWMVNFEHQKRH